MPAFFDRLRGRSDPPTETKSTAPPLVALALSGRAGWSSRGFPALAREGFKGNPVAYRCVRMIAEAAASVPMMTAHEDVAKLLGAGATGMTATDLFERFYGLLHLSGAGFLELVLVDEQPRLLCSLQPDRVEVLIGRDGRSVGYRIDRGVGFRTVRPDALTGRSPVFHMRLFDPFDETAGFSPLAAAGRAVDIHNAGAQWTKSLLDNAARPSGALIFKGSESGHYLSRDQFDRVKNELESAYAGAMNAGRPMVLEGGLDWKSMSLTPADMDFLQARREAAREIALALGVPPMLLGIPGDNTYANYKEANLAFWRQTIIPLVRKTAAGLSAWLAPYFDDDLLIRPDVDQVPALASERSALWSQLTAAGFLSDAERRRLAGLGGEHG